MPNHVANVVKMKGIMNLPLFSVDKEGEKYFDFNKLIPMPESLNISSGSSTDENIVYYLTNKCTVPIKKLSDDKKMMLNKLVGNMFHKGSWSEEVFRRVVEKTAQESEEQKQKRYDDGRIYVQNYMEYGCTTWYDWCCRYWGTKWNAYSFEEWDEDTIKFETAWSCPEPILIQLAKMYPDAQIEHWWADEDCGNNTGYMEFEDGKWYGGYDDACSSDAYEHYDYCWGGSECIYQDEEGNYCKYECETCRKCY